MMWGFFDPMYLVFVAPAMLLALWAQMRVKSAYAEASEIGSRSRLTGAAAAEELLHAAGIHNVRVEPVEGFMSDHYSPTEKVLRLSPEVYNGQSLAALGIAAHEAGHALQDAERYPLLVARNALVPLASVGGNLSWIILMVGFVLASTQLVMAGIVAFSATVLFQLVNLPVEFDASRRARIVLADAGMITREEDVYVKKVLDAAAMTYVAATISAIMTLLYFLFRSGLLGGNRS